MFGALLFLSFGILAYLFTSPDPLSFRIPGWWVALLLLPVIISVALTARARQVRLIVKDSEDLDIVNEWVQTHFLPKDHRINPDGSRETILHSKNLYGRFFGGWFGAELISIQQEENRIIIRGPLRLIRAVDSDLRYENLHPEEA